MAVPVASFLFIFLMLAGFPSILAGDNNMMDGQPAYSSPQMVNPFPRPPSLPVSTSDSLTDMNPQPQPTPTNPTDENTTPASNTTDNSTATVAGAPQAAPVSVNASLSASSNSSSPSLTPPRPKVPIRAMTNLEEVLHDTYTQLHRASFMLHPSQLSIQQAMQSAGVLRTDLADFIQMEMCIQMEQAVNSTKEHVLYMMNILQDINLDDASDIINEIMNSDQVD